MKRKNEIIRGLSATNTNMEFNSAANFQHSFEQGAMNASHQIKGLRHSLEQGAMNARNSTRLAPTSAHNQYKGLTGKVRKLFSHGSFRDNLNKQRSSPFFSVDASSRSIKEDASSISLQINGEDNNPLDPHDPQVLTHMRELIVGRTKCEM